jgi:DNA-binding NarL/FixJ family response regulator
MPARTAREETMTEVRVIVVDDHAVLREGLQQLINAQPDMTIVAEARGAGEALELTAEDPADVILMDLSLPDGDGIVVTEHILQRYPQARVVGLTRHEDRGYMRRMLRVGARGYVLKQNIANELLTAIRTVAAGETYIDRGFMGRPHQREHDNSTAREAAHVPEPTESELSADEVVILQQVAVGCTNGEIAEQLGMPSVTVAEHKAHAMEKLGLRTRIDVLRYAEAQGWKRTILGGA